MLRLIYRIYQIYLFFVRPLTFGVRVLLLRRGRVLLVRQTYMNGWFIPGGGVKRGETLEQAARREAREEVQAQLKQISLVGVYSNFQEWKSDHNVLFYSDKFTLGGGHDNEIAEMRFFSLDALPAGLWPGHRQRLLEFGPDLARGRVPSPPRFGEW
ncbi:MAG TPA: NUDIX domain-containing protein [Anaerolineales bacterium]